MTRGELAAAVEGVLLTERYAGFMAAALSLSDAQESGLLIDDSAFAQWCLSTAQEIAGTAIDTLKPLIEAGSAPALPVQALNAIANGVYFRTQAEVQ
jgi:hypothetical protein